MATQQDPYSDATKIASQEGTEIDSGLLQNTDIGNSSCLSFDGVNDYVAIDNNFLASGVGRVTVSTWVKFDDLNARRHILRKGHGNFGADSIVLRYEPSGSSFSFSGSAELQFGIEELTGADFSYAYYAGPLVVGRWYHVAGTWDKDVDGGAVRIYVNGVVGANNNNPKTLAIDPNAVMHIGQNTVDNLYFKGSIDDVRIYNRALSASEIADLYLGESVSSTGLVGWWKFDDGTGTSAADSSGNSNTGTVDGAQWSTQGVYSPRGQTVSTSKLGSSDTLTAVNSFKYTSTQKTGGTRGVFQFSDDNSTWKRADGTNVTNVSALSFDGTNDYVDVGDIDAVDGATALTYGGWVYANRLNEFQHIISKFSDASNRVVLAGSGSGEGGTDDFTIGIGTGSANALAYTTDGSLQAQVWVHVMVVFDGSQTGNANRLKIYVDGVQKTLTFSGTIPATTVSNSASVVIGARDSSLRFWNGLLDDIRIYSRALSASEIQALYQGKDVDDTNLEGWWKFDDNTGTSATDSSGNGNTGTIFGATWVSDWWRLPQWGDAIEDTNVLYFDGVGDRAQAAVANFESGSTSGTITAWIKTTHTTDSRIFSSADESGTNDVIGLGILGSSGKLFMQTNVSGTVDRVDGSTVINDGRWHHVAVTSSGTAWALYVDGFAESLTVGAGSNSGNWFGDVSNRDNIVIGGLLRSSFVSDFQGEIANVAVYSDVFSAAEVLTDFQNGYADTGDANLVAYWKVNEGTGTTLDNAEGTATYDLTLTGGTWIKDEHRPIPASPTQQTIDLSTIGASWTNFYYRAFTQNQASYTNKLTEVTLEYLTELNNIWIFVSKINKYYSIGSY